jgi:hypothetical protein
MGVLLLLVGIVVAAVAVVQAQSALQNPPPSVCACAHTV